MNKNSYLDSRNRDHSLKFYKKLSSSFGRVESSYNEISSIKNTFPLLHSLTHSRRHVDLNFFHFLNLPFEDFFLFFLIYADIH